MIVPVGPFLSGRPGVRRLFTTVVLTLVAVGCNEQSGSERSSREQTVPQDGRCEPSGTQLERRRILEFFEAYNTGDEATVRRLTDLDELWDPAGAPVHGSLRPELAEWLAAGTEVEDHFVIETMCVYPGAGRDGNLSRSNQLLSGEGIGSLSQSVKIGMEQGILKRIVIYMPQGDVRAQFCVLFGEAIQKAERAEPPESPQC